MDIYFLIQILVGFVGLIAIAFPFSENYKIINYKYVFYGVLSQILLAIVSVSYTHLTLPTKA